MDAVAERTQLNIADATTVANDLFRALRFEEAGRLFAAIAEHEPHNLHAVQCVGICLSEQGRHAEALKWFDRAGIICREEAFTVTSNRAKSLGEIGRTQEAHAIFDGLVRAFPDRSLPLNCRGLMKLQAGDMQGAIADFDACLAIDPKDDNARFGRGFARLVLGDYAQGFADYECRRKDMIKEPDAPLWDGSEDLSGKTILVYGEQGLGDNIMFARYLPMLVERGAGVLVWTPPALRPFLAHLEGVRILPDDREIWPSFDCWVRFMSLAWCFRTVVATVPPPVALPSAMTWPVRSNKRLTVGLVWSGARHSRYDEHRSVPLAMLAPLFDLGDVNFVSLQLDVRDGDREAFEALKARGLVDLSAELTDFAATARHMASLDLMITVDTSVAHLAGTVGVPTMVMLTAFRTYWLWIQKLSSSPWYPSIRVVQQEVDGNWAGVVARVGQELVRFVEDHSASKAA